MTAFTCTGCYVGFSGPWCDNCDRWPCTCPPANGACCVDAAEGPDEDGVLLHTAGCVNRCAVDTPCLAANGGPGTYPCGASKGHNGEHWVPPAARHLPEQPDRCPSRIAHTSGAVLRCQDVPGHLGLHATVHERWSDDDDRILAETIPQVQAARAEREFSACRQPEASDARTGYDRAIEVLRDVADRTGSAAARWAADYLTADPDRMAPAPPLTAASLEAAKQRWLDQPYPSSI